MGAEGRDGRVRVASSSPRRWAGSGQAWLVSRWWTDSWYQLRSEDWRVSWGWAMGPSDSPEPQPLHVPDGMCWQCWGKKQHVLDKGRAAGCRGGSWGSEVLSWGWGRGDGAASPPGIWSLAVPALPPLAPGPRGLAEATLKLPWVLTGPHPSPRSVRPGNVAWSLQLGAVCWQAGRQGRAGGAPPWWPRSQLPHPPAGGGLQPHPSFPISPEGG